MHIIYLSLKIIVENRLKITLNRNLKKTDAVPKSIRHLKTAKKNVERKEINKQNLENCLCLVQIRYIHMIATMVSISLDMNKN